MHVQGILHELLFPVIYKKTLESLSLMVSSLLKHKKLAVTALGRTLDLGIQERSGIRRADRLIGNKHLHAHREEIYGIVSKQIIGIHKRPRIMADWSHIPNTHNYVLRASLASKKRAITLYEEVHPVSKLSNHIVETKFLQKLHQLIPQGCHPIILTDAGFRNGWFAAVEKLGWGYVGRIRGQGDPSYHQEGKEWRKCKDLYKEATSKIKFLGKVTLSKRSLFSTYFYLYKKASQNHSRKIRTRKHGCRDKKYYQRMAREPWLLATSISGENYLKRTHVIQLYRLRMQIEESFRDLKCARDGFGMENAYSYKTHRIELLLLLAMLASFLAYLLGFFAEKKGWRPHFQVNSDSRQTISLWYLGIQVFRREDFPSDLSLDEFLAISRRFIA